MVPYPKTSLSLSSFNNTAGIGPRKNLDLTPAFSFVSEDLSSILDNFSKQNFR